MRFGAQTLIYYSGDYYVFMMSELNKIKDNHSSTRLLGIIGAILHVLIMIAIIAATGIFTLGFFAFSHDARLVYALPILFFGAAPALVSSILVWEVLYKSRNGKHISLLTKILVSLPYPLTLIFALYIF